MFKLNEVIEGLMAGKSYQRTLKDDGGKEYLSPAGDGRFRSPAGERQFRHDVAGKAHGGWGSSNIMPIADLVRFKSRWAQDGWELST